MTNYQNRPPRFGSARTPDLYTNRDLTFGSDVETPNQFVPLGPIPQTAYWKGSAVAWELHVNSFYSGGLGRVRGNLSTVLNRVRGEVSGAPLESRYTDSLGLPLITRRSTTPALSSTSPTAVAYREESTNSGTGTTATGNKPTGTADGDTLVAWVIHDDASTSVSAVPAGWELKESVSPGSTGDFKAYMYTKIAASEGSSWAWTLSASERWRVVVVAAQNGTATGVAATTSQLLRAAKRFYMPSSGTAAISPSYDSGWDVTSAALRLPSSIDKQSTPITQVSYSDTNKSDQDILFRQYVVTRPLAAQTISAQTVKIQMQAVEGGDSTAGNNLFLAWSVKVVTSAGALRGQVVALRRDATELTLGYPEQNRGDSTTSTSVAAQNGDYLVFEVGYGGDPGTGSFDDHDGGIKIGDSASTDLPEDNTTTTFDRSPWIEFANDITFEDAAGSGELATSVSRAGSMILSFAAVDVDAIRFTGATDSGGTITEQLDSSATQISVGLYSELVSAVGEVTHTLTRASGTTDLALFSVLIQPAVGGVRMSHINLFGSHAIAVGDANLYRETGDLTPSIEQTSYDPASPINGLAEVIIGGATAPKRVAILRTDDPIALLDDLSSNPTVNGTAMHADTEPAFGLIQTVLFGTPAAPEDDILIYAKNALWALSRADSIGAAPTKVYDYVPNGGGAIGELWVPGQPIREFWMLPDEDCGTTQAEVLGVPMWPYSTNAFGTDLQKLDLPLLTTQSSPAHSYVSAAIWQQGMAVSDGYRLVNYTGRVEIMNWPGERYGVGDQGQLLIRGLRVKAGQLRVLVQRVSLYGGGGNSLWWEEEYDENTRRFHQVTRVIDSGTVGDILGSPSIGSLPVSAVSEIGYWHDGTQWAAQLFSDIMRNPVYDFNGIDGAGLQFGFEDEASATSAEMTLPGLANVPSIVTEIVYAGSPELGGDDAEVSVLIADQSRTSMTFPSEGAGVSATFLASDRWERNHRPFPDNVSAWDRLQYKVIGRRGSDASQSPQCLPVIIRGISFLDGRVEAPRKVLGAEWIQRFS